MLQALTISSTITTNRYNYTTITTVTTTKNITNYTHFSTITNTNINTIVPIY